MGIFGFLRRRTKTASTASTGEGIRLETSLSAQDEEMLGLVADTYMEFGPEEGARLVSTLSADELHDLLDSRTGTTTSPARPDLLVIVKEPPFPDSYDRGVYVHRILDALLPEHKDVDYEFLVEALPDTREELNDVIVRFSPDADPERTRLKTFDDTDGGKGVLVCVYQSPSAKSEHTENASRAKIVEPEYPAWMTSRTHIPPEARRIRVDADCEVVPIDEYACPACGEFIDLPRTGPNVVVRFELDWGAYFWWSVVTHCDRKLLMSNRGM